MFAGSGGNASITDGSGTATSGDGGDVNIFAGAGGTASGGGSQVTGAWGDILLQTGTASGTGAGVGGGKVVQRSGNGFATTGDAQSCMYVLRAATTNNTPTEMFLGQTVRRMTVASDSTWMFEIKIVARRTDVDGESAAYIYQGCIDNNAGTTAIVGSVIETIVAEDTAAWSVSVTADDTNDALIITVTGENSKTIRWVAFVRTVETTG